MRSENISYRQARSGKWIVFEKLSPYQGSTGYRTGHQYARFDTEAEAVEYMTELKADLERKEVEIERMLRQPLPATPQQVDPFNHPAFWFIDVDERKEAVERAAIREMLTPEQLAIRPLWYREWGNTEVIVYDGYESPYQFGKLLRQLMENDSAIIFRYNPRNIYFAMATASCRVAYYDPAKRDHIPEYVVDGEIDWFKAVDSLAVPNDLITQAEAARRVGVSTQAIHNATRDGRLTGYPNPDAEYERQGVTLVSQAAVENIEWKKRDGK